MASPAELRSEARLFGWIAQQEPDPHLKRRLASHAFALAQLAEQIEQDEAARADSPPQVATS